MTWEERFSPAIAKEKIAIRSSDQTTSFEEVFRMSQSVASCLLSRSGLLTNQCVGIMVNPGSHFVAALWGTWQSGAIAVPICLTHPLPSIEYVAEDTSFRFIICSEEFLDFLKPLSSKFSIELIPIDVALASQSTRLPDVGIDNRALILYTSGTTSRPKGVVTTHRQIHAQIQTLLTAWEWSSADEILCVLPLHHVHGLINVVNCSLLAGATCTFVESFDATNALMLLSNGRLNVFMAVPTIYHKLISAWQHLPQEKQQHVSKSLSAFRLMVCGSAALPVSVLQQWKEISGHTLLERYGMTELGMAISNPYRGERRPGFVGKPLPGVSVRLVGDQGENLINGPGEIQVKGENVFLEYWRKPEETGKSFTGDGWFRTGDVAVLEDGYYRIMGRLSVDIIKSGGYKISALEVEEVLRQHPHVSDCAVVGIENEEWGEVVAAAIIPGETSPDIAELTDWMKKQLPSYRVPRKFFFTAELPRNAMGKVVKNDVKKFFV